MGTVLNSKRPYCAKAVIIFGGPDFDSESGTALTKI
jgi:hypothetical protein